MLCCRIALHALRERTVHSRGRRLDDRTAACPPRCKPIFDLGSGPHNTVRWSPQGRFLAVAGFGNLPGDLVFYEKKADGKCKQIAATRWGRRRECSPCVIPSHSIELFQGARKANELPAHLISSRRSGAGWRTA